MTDNMENMTYNMVGNLIGLLAKKGIITWEEASKIVRFDGLIKFWDKEDNKKC